MREDKQQAKPWLPDTEVRCPVSPAAQEWVESSLRWRTGEFGRETLVRDVVLPAAGFFPVPYTATAQQIEAIVTRSCALMGLEPGVLRVDLFDGSEEKRKARAHGTGKVRTVGHFHMEGGVTVIGLDRSESADPSYLTAIITHELGHVRLLAEPRISAGRRDHERLTDLLTVYFGFGIFSDNAALDYAEAARSWSVHALGELDERTLNTVRNGGYRRLGYLSEHEFGYTLACYCWLREEREEPRWGLPQIPSSRGWTWS